MRVPVSSSRVATDTPGKAGRARRSAGACAGRPRRPDPGRRGRQPEPRGRQRRAPRHRQGVRLVADDARPDRGRLLARPRGVGPVPRRAGRPLRPQADADPRHRPVDPRLHPRRVGADRRGAGVRSDRRRDLRGHGVPHHARAHHRAVVRSTAHARHRAVVGDRRRRSPRSGRSSRAGCSGTSGGARCSSSRCRSRPWRWSWRSASSPPT